MFKLLNDIKQYTNVGKINIMATENFMSRNIESIPQDANS